MTEPVKKPRYSKPRSWKLLKPEDMTYALPDKPMTGEVKAKLEFAKKLLGARGTPQTTLFVMSDRGWSPVAAPGSKKKSKY
jgi:hypothetical protein